ncbi:MAG: OmpH family outer membrane protein [Mediterranea sp.]|jgi:outer membrane protein|nr:OmpH family outer membrane protein [Mediterranea sp.]
MKKTNKLVGTITAIVIIFLFAQCSGKHSNQTATESSDRVSEVSGLKIAYVEIDTLLTQYNFWKDLTEMTTKKEEEIRATLNQKGKELEQDAQDFQRKLENNAFVSRERAEQEQSRIIKKQQDLQELQNRLTNELMAETHKNNLQLRDSINSYLKDYNKTRGYSFIISNTGSDNLLYANRNYNITQEIVEGLNARYVASTKK